MGRNHLLCPLSYGGKMEHLPGIRPGSMPYRGIVIPLYERCMAWSAGLEPANAVLETAGFPIEPNPIKWCPRQDLNLKPSGYEPGTLSIELHGQLSEHNGAPGRIRTCGHLFRKETLYSAELQGLIKTKMAPGAGFEPAYDTD